MIAAGRLLALAALLLAGLPAAGQLAIVRREALTRAPWSADEARWIRQHGGVIFYEDGPTPRCTMSELIDMAHALGVRQVKTWLTGTRPGEMRQKLARPDYGRILSGFDTVLFDGCPDFMLQGPCDAAKAQTIREGVARARRAGGRESDCRNNIAYGKIRTAPDGQGTRTGPAAPGAP